MATCPRCLGPLTDNHRCPRSRSRRGVETAGLLLAGATAGVLACYGLIERPHTVVVLAAGTLGALLAQALRQAINPQA
jgi:hypothetical protein